MLWKRVNDGQEENRVRHLQSSNILTEGVECEPNLEIILTNIYRDSMWSRNILPILHGNIKFPQMENKVNVYVCFPSILSLITNLTKEIGALCLIYNYN